MLVRRCVAGDAAAWEEIVQTYNRRIYNICYRFAGSADDAEDLAQEVFIKMYRTLASYDSSKGAFVTWVTTITRNLLVDHFRKTTSHEGLSRQICGLRHCCTIGDYTHNPPLSAR